MSDVLGRTLALVVMAAFMMLSASCQTAADRTAAGNSTPPATAVSKADGAEMIFVPAGEFTMGADDLHFDQRPIHKMYVDAFYIDKYEVTNAQYKKFVDATGHPAPHSDEIWAQPFNWIDGTYHEGQGNYPVALVSWYDAKAYAQWAGKRLPTEPEWEKAARGTDGRLYPWGDEPDASRVNSWEMGPGRALPVGSYPLGASFYGLMDMGGNAWEWVEDWFERYPGNEWPSDKYGPKYKVARGSSWGNVMKYVRTSNRHWLEPEHKSGLIGLRTASTDVPR